MKSGLLLVLFMFLSSHSLSQGSFICDDLVGAWEGSSFEYSIKAQKTFKTTFKKDRTFKVEFYLTDGVEEIIQEESGVWDCDGTYVVMHTQKVAGDDVDYVDLFEYLQLTTAYRKYRMVLANCEDIIGDCFGKTFESVKVK